MSGVPIPNPCDFLDKMQPIGAVNGEKRWRSPKGRLYTWDSLHGEIEVFNKRGRHLGVMDCKGNQIKDSVNGRSIDV